MDDYASIRRSSNKCAKCKVKATKAHNVWFITRL